MHNQIQMSPKLCDEAYSQLRPFMEGTAPSDAFTFAFLSSIGVSWQQLRILLAALPLWTTCNLDPSWDIMQRGPVRSMLKRQSLDYLRQRLQVRPSDIYRMLKTHTRLSSYDACFKLRPTFDKLQGSLRLSSVDMRKLVLRMPSVMGAGKRALDDRIDLFANRGKMLLTTEVL
jgi:hypothetical protein